MVRGVMISGHMSTVLTALTVLCFWLGSGESARAQSRPNLVFFLSDDQGVDAIQGAPWSNELNVRTPWLADLARRGRSMTTTRVNPYCSPTRACIMTGRLGFDTGVTGVINENRPLPDRDLLSMQREEQTIAEVLQDLGYYTILIDKWHLGWNDSMGTTPVTQGFDVAIEFQDLLQLDDPVQTGDEHLSRMVDFAIDAVDGRPGPDQPYALFFWSIDAHSRAPDPRNGFLWWEVKDNLLPSGENYYRNESNRNRYRAVIEAVDTEFNRMLKSLDVVGSDGRYESESNTIVIYMGDNGTPAQVAPDATKAKGTLYEGGIRVPLIVFGENVPSDGRTMPQLVSHVDLFDTIADIAGAPVEIRGELPRESVSFADAVGWSASDIPDREYSISSLGHPDDPAQHLVAISDARYKLIARGGGQGLAPLAGDEFYDLLLDSAEQNNLVGSGMNNAQLSAYRRLRGRLTGFWPSALGAPTSLNTDVRASDTLSLDSSDQVIASRMSIGFDPVGRESRAFVRIDVDTLIASLPQGRTLQDIESAELILVFQTDANGLSDEDVGPMTAHAMTVPWHISPPSWDVLVNAFDPVPLGSVDIPPHVIPNPQGDNLTGVPLSLGTPVSFGQSADLADRIRAWDAAPESNNGLVVRATDPLALSGDRRVHFLQLAGVRCTLRERN